MSKDGEGLFRVIVEDCEKVDFTTYYSDSNSEDNIFDGDKDALLSDKKSHPPRKRKINTRQVMVNFEQNQSKNGWVVQSHGLFIL